MNPQIPRLDYLYIAFDLFPSQKGAATHIGHCLQALQKTFGKGMLICLGSEEMPVFQYDEERQLYVFRFRQRIVNFLERTLAFQQTDRTGMPEPRLSGDHLLRSDKELPERQLPA